ncbi:MAG: hypothetical protein QMD12_00555 [Candidatus Aenigmarchaeota archaeon]|nr:hypothetical protein [Candidatus Aenigmarchaeota archaeon]
MGRPTVIIPGKPKDEKDAGSVGRLTDILLTAEQGLKYCQARDGTFELLLNQ